MFAEASVVLSSVVETSVWGHWRVDLGYNVCISEGPVTAPIGEEMQGPEW